MFHHDDYSSDALRPTELHDFSDVPFDRPSLGRAAPVVIAIVAMFGTVHQIAGVKAGPNALLVTEQAHVQDAAPNGSHIRLD